MEITIDCRRSILKHYSFSLRRVQFLNPSSGPKFQLRNGGKKLKYEMSKQHIDTTIIAYYHITITDNEDYSAFWVQKKLQHLAKNECCRLLSLNTTINFPERSHWSAVLVDSVTEASPGRMSCRSVQT